MNNKQSTVSTLFTAVRIIHLLIAGLIVALVTIHFAELFVFELRFNIYGVLSLVALIANLVLLILVNRPQNRSPDTFWFSMFLFHISMWAFGETMMRFSAGPEQAMFWYSLTVFGWIPMGVMLFMYTLTWVGHVDKVRNTFGLALVGMIFILIFVALSTNLLIDFRPENAFLTSWGYHSPYGALFPLYLAWLELFLLTSLAMMFMMYRSARTKLLRTRAAFNVVAILIPVVGGSITDGILPLLGIRVFSTAIPLTTVMSLVIGYAIVRHKIFSVNNAIMASNILSSMSDAVLIMDKNFNIEYANPSGAHLLGRSRERLVGLPLGKFFDNDDYLVLTSKMEHLRGHGQSSQGRYRFKTRKGLFKPSLISVSRINAAEADEGGYALVATDLSMFEKVVKENEILAHARRAMADALEESKRLELELTREKISVERKIIERTKQLTAEQAKLSASINSVSIGFIITDDQLRLVSANEASRKIVHTQTDDVLHELILKLSESVHLKRKIRHCLDHHKEVTIRDILMGKNYLQIFIAPIMLSPDEAIGTVILVQDVTEEKALQRSRDEFFSIASHELRTPLTAIRGNTSMIHSFYSKELANKPELGEMIDDIHASSTRLIEIVNDFLDVSRLEQGNIEFAIQPIDVAEIIQAVCEEVNSISNEKSVEILNRVESPLIVQADANRAKQVMYNLIGNALKFTKEGDVTVSAEISNGFAKILVTDTGKGIPQSKQHLLFHKFQQAGTDIITRDTNGGTGLGLYISKLLAEKMGGTISLEHSEEGKGTTFSVTFPLSPKK